MRLLKTVQHLSRKDSDRTAHLMLFAQIAYSIWLARNNHVLEGSPGFIAIEVPLRVTEDDLHAQSLVLLSGRKYVRLIMAKQLIAGWRASHLLMQRNPQLLATI
ncbi:unnamed protein product [Calypogeia fissa]